MFTIDRNGDLIGYSIWPADSLYAPLVGCYGDGRLKYVASCGEPPQTMRMAGPRHRCWFRMPVDSALRDRLQAGDPAVKLLRTEDAASVDLVDAPPPRPLRRVEDFLASALHPTVALTGFPAFLGAPLTHQLDILFLDFLGRLPDPGARSHYLDLLKRGLSPLVLRHDLMKSEEFTRRRLTISDRIGAMVTSPTWHVLAQSEALDEAPTCLNRLKLSDHAGQSDREFARAVYQRCFDTSPPDDVIDELEDIGREHGRTTAASHLIRHAAENGVFLVLVDA